MFCTLGLMLTIMDGPKHIEYITLTDTLHYFTTLDCYIPYNICLLLITYYTIQIQIHNHAFCIQ